MPPVLLVEDRDSLRAMLRSTLEAEGYAVEEAADGPQAIKALAGGRYLAVVTDLKLPGADGHAVLAAAREADSNLPVIVMTAYGTIEDAVGAMKRGAYDFLSKPVDPDHLLLLLGRAVERRGLLEENLLLKKEFAERLGFPRIIGEAAGLVEATRQVQKAAPTDATILLLGESGTGKELFARAVHQLSPRKDGPFVAINCAAIPEDTSRERAVRPREGGVHGRHLDEARHVSKWPTAARSSSTRSATWGPRSRPSCCAFSRTGRSRGSGARDPEGRRAHRRGDQSRSEARRGRPQVPGGSLLPPRGRAGPDPAPSRARFRPSRAGGAFPRDVPAGAREGWARDSPRRRWRRSAGHRWPGNVRELENAVERAAILAEGDLIEPRHLALVPAAAAEGGDLDAISHLFDLSGGSTPHRAACAITWSGC